MRESDENFDRRLRECLEPDRQSVERLRSRVLAGDRVGRPVRWALALCACAVPLAAFAGLWSWHSRSAPVDLFTATLDGDVLVFLPGDELIQVGCIVGARAGLVLEFQNAVVKRLRGLLTEFFCSQQLFWAQTWRARSAGVSMAQTILVASAFSADRVKTANGIVEGAAVAGFRAVEQRRVGGFHEGLP